MVVTCSGRTRCSAHARKASLARQTDQPYSRKTHTAPHGRSAGAQSEPRRRTESPAMVVTCSGRTRCSAHARKASLARQTNQLKKDAHGADPAIAAFAVRNNGGLASLSYSEVAMLNKCHLVNEAK